MLPRTHVELFQKSGAEANLRYLWSRLAQRDLSDTEALAMLSAVHRELGRSEAADTRLYVSYARFLQALQREMPAVHQHVVGTWRESRVAGRSTPVMQDNMPMGDDEIVESPQENPGQTTDPSVKQFIQAVQLEFGHEEGPEEPGELDERDSESDAPAKELPRGGGEEAENGEPDDEPEPRDEAKEPEDANDQQEAAEAEGRESKPEAGDDVEEVADSEPEHGNNAEDSHAEEAGDADVGSDEEHEPESIEDGQAEESGPTKGEAQPSAERPGDEEGEWPAEEQPEAAERLEEFEGDEGETPEPD